MKLSQSDKITLAICLVFLLCIGAKVIIGTKQVKAKAITLSAEPQRTTEPNYAQIIADKDRQIQHWKSMCSTLETRNAENVREFERQYKKLEKRK